MVRSLVNNRASVVAYEANNRMSDMDSEASPAKALGLQAMLKRGYGFVTRNMGLKTQGVFQH